MMIQEYFDINTALSIISFDALLYLGVVFLLIWIGKWVNDLLTPYSINDELTKNDNNALSLSYAGYLMAQGIIVLGLFRGEDAPSLLEDLLGIVVWSLIGIVLLNIARIINDKVLFSKFDNTKEIITDRNAGVGAVQFGSYLGTGFLINAVLSGESEGYLNDIIATVLFFVVGQIGFVIFAKIYAKVVGYDLHDEIEKDNVSAGVSAGLTLTAIGIIMSHSIVITNSIPAFIVWFVNGVALLMVTRFVVDKVILPKQKLDDEIAQDQNLGVAIIEGGMVVVVALLINASFA
jgi:uncharacterized membrane protein YjfL (UPF0719 family)